MQALEKKRQDPARIAKFHLRDLASKEMAKAGIPATVTVTINGQDIPAQVTVSLENGQIMYNFSGAVTIPGLPHPAKALGNVLLGVAPDGWQAVRDKHLPGGKK